jgi:hypothetical protein
MRTVVGLVDARPETIVDDYRRVLALAGLSVPAAPDGVQVLVAGGTGGFEPGWSATPWQLDAVLGWLGPRERPCQVLAIDQGGAAALGTSEAWRDGLSRHSALPLAAESLRPRRVQSALALPALQTVLPAGVMLPAGLLSGTNFLLAAPTLRHGSGVAGATAHLRELVTAGARIGRRAPAAEVTVEAVGVTREHMPQLGIVLDGTLWGVEGGRCVARNVLLAGTDPVAVDTVAMHLAGVETRRVPWLRICHDRGLGVGRLAEIRIVGRTDLADLDFELPGGTFAAGEEATRWPGVGRVRRLGRRAGGRSAAGLTGSSWEELALQYRGAAASARSNPEQA